MDNLVSIIIPVYNVETYLVRCIESVRNQTYSNIEVLLIDDGSTDSSLTICEEYAKKDDRIMVYHKENGGLSSARNYGIDKANGKWLFFLDSDDWISLNAISDLLTSAIEFNCQISIGCFLFCYSPKDFIEQATSKNIEVYTSQEALYEMTSGLKFEFHACNKLFEKNLFDGIRFPINKLYEDMFTIYKVVDNAQDVVYNSKAKYAYFQRSESIANSSFNIKQMDWYYALKEYQSFCKKNYPELKEVLNNYSIFTCISLINKLMNSDLKKYYQEYSLLRNEIKNDYIQYLFSNIPGLSVNLKYKVGITLFLISRSLYYRLFNFLK